MKNYKITVEPYPNKQAIHYIKAKSIDEAVKELPWKEESIINIEW